MSNSLTANEHLTWYTPSQALGRLPRSWSDVTKKRAIARRLADGLLRAAAGVVVWKDGRSEGVGEFKRGAWDQWSYAYDNDFWTTGTFAGLRSDASGYGHYEAAKFRAHDVRFEPAGVEAIVPVPSPRVQEENLAGWARLAEKIEPTLRETVQKIAEAQQRAPQISKAAAPITPVEHRVGTIPRERSMGPPASPGVLLEANPPETIRKDYLTYDEVAAWHAALPPEDRARGWRWLWDAVRTACAPRSVYKKHVLQLVDGRPKGRPKKNVPGNVPGNVPR